MKCIYYSNESHEKIIENYLSNINNDISIVDVGGAASLYKIPISYTVIDVVKKPNTSDESNILFNLDSDLSWKNVTSNIKEKFNISICSHTLEDILNPEITLKNLPLISKKGIIIVPSYNKECKNIESSNYKGNCHHKWLYKIMDNRLIGVNKMSMFDSIEFASLYEKINLDASIINLVIEWEEVIDYKLFCTGIYPLNSPSLVIDFYKNFFIN